MDRLQEVRSLFRCRQQLKGKLKLGALLENQRKQYLFPHNTSADVMFRPLILTKRLQVLIIHSTVVINPFH